MLHMVRNGVRPMSMVKTDVSCRKWNTMTETSRSPSGSMSIMPTVPRRSWARNEAAVFSIKREMERTPGLKVTLPNFADEQMIESVLKNLN